jgi:hypothetical protein
MRLDTVMHNEAQTLPANLRGRPEGPKGTTVMRIVRFLPTAILTAFAVATAAPALADDSLNGHFRLLVDGSESSPLGASILGINSQCDGAGNCSGWASTPRTWGAAINKSAGGPWTIDRADREGWSCPDGSKAPADLAYSFAAATLTGSVVATKSAGACGDPARPTKTHALHMTKCVDDPNRGVCP